MLCGFLKIFCRCVVCGLGNQFAVNDVSLALADSSGVTHGVGLDGVDDMQRKAKRQECRVKRKPVVPSSLHADDHLGRISRNLSNGIRELLRSGVGVGEAEGLAQRGAPLVDDYGLVVVLGDVDAYDDHAVPSFMWFGQRKNSSACVSQPREICEERAKALQHPANS